MKHLFLALNSKYIHTLLAPHYLTANCPYAVKIIQSNVNTDIYELTEEILAEKPDTIAISCYIFNIAFVRKLLPILREKLPMALIILGGYEVTFDVERYLTLANYIIKGEGDFVYGKLIDSIENGVDAFGQIIEAKTVEKLDEIASPYNEEYGAMGKTKILYMETTRGCPFKCSYCMSANTKGVRSFSLERALSDVDKLMAYAPKQIKFVDRTFNYDIKRATAIFSHIIEKYNDKNTNFHFEMAPELFDSGMLEVLRGARKGLMQFEIGVQSYNPDTLSAVNRYANVDRVDANLKYLSANTQVLIHVDLIAGLPFEGYESFIKGFDRLFLAKPHCLQLGFLKVLKGSQIYEMRGKYKINDLPPYEIICSEWISCEELERLKVAERTLERYYNSGRFANTIKFLIPEYASPFEFFLGIGLWQKEKKIEVGKLSAFYQSEVLYDYLTERIAPTRPPEGVKEWLQKAKTLINDDYRLSGNTRKWRRNV